MEVEPCKYLQKRGKLPCNFHLLPSNFHIPIMKPCEKCNQNLATVFVTKMSGNQTQKLSLCEQCARAQALDIGWMAGLQLQPDTPLEELVQQLLENLSAEDAIKSFAFDNDDDKWSLAKLAALDKLEKSGEWPADEDLVDELDEDFADDDDFDPENFDLGELVEDDFDGELDEELTRAIEHDMQVIHEHLSAINSDDDYENSDPFADLDEPQETNRRAFEVVRCAKCGTTWDRLREDGRAGCSTCYETFAAQLQDAMQRMSADPQHIGKTPRALTRRKRRLEHLRARRDNRLAMLRERLERALKSEDFDEAARLRDKIKIVESTIVDHRNDFPEV